MSRPITTSFVIALGLAAPSGALGQASSPFLGGWSTPVAPLIPVAELEADGTLRVHGTTGSDVVTVTGPNASLQLTVTRGTFSATFGYFAVTRIAFDGDAGDDTFTNHTARPAELHGGDGNDALQGGSGDDFIVGGYGQDVLRGGAGRDVLWGSGGSDDLYGEAGDDRLVGHGGNDLLRGGDGRDRLYPGTGSDVVYGDAGQDDIIAVGGDSDTVVGGGDADNFWVDPVDAVSDASSHELGGGYVKVVSSYEDFATPLGPVAAPLALTGPNLPDPAPAPGDLVIYRDFSDRPLFASTGIDFNDVDQNSLGDCYFLSKLAAFAHQQPELVRKMVTDLGDGTYAVRFFDGGTPVFVRVDGHLPTRLTSTRPIYAGLGAEDAIWAAIIEKAFAVFRERQNTYGSIEGGNGPYPHDEQLGGNYVGQSFTGRLTKEQVMRWDIIGRPAGATATTIETQADLLLDWVEARLAEGRPMFTGAVSSVSNSTPVNGDTYRRGQHIVMIHSVTGGGRSPRGLVLYDQNVPNQTKTISDPVVLYYAIGRAFYFEES